MDKVSIQGLKIKVLSAASFAFLLLFSSACTCYAAPYKDVDCSKYNDSKLKNQCMLKKSFTIDITTTWPGVPDRKYHTTNADGTIKHWLVSNVGDESVLYANLRCDNKVVGSDFYAQNPCDTNGKNDDWIKTDDLEYDTNVNSVEKEYTVNVSASDGNGMDSIRIEWANNDVSAVPTSWPSGQGHTCNSDELRKNGGACKICREGTKCENGTAMIPANALSVKKDGKMNRLWFRIIITDKAGLSITVGDDNYKTGWNQSNMPLFLDKYYQFQICNLSGCSGKCGLAPVVGAASVDGSKCAEGKPYTFTWNIDKNGGGVRNGQSEFTLELSDAATGKPVDTKTNVPAVTNGNSYSYTPSDWYVGQGGKLKSNTKYTWKVRIKDNAAPVGGTDCKQWSQYKDGPAFQTCSGGGGGGDCVPENKAPWAVTIKNGNSIKDPCEGYLYTLYWNFFDSDNDPGRNKQSAYQVRVREYNKNNTPESNILYDSGIIKSSNAYHALTNASWIKYGKTYEWQVRVYDNDSREKCKKVSQWTVWTGTSDISITTPKHKYPTVAFAITNPQGKNCIPQGCGFLQDIKFADSGSTTYSSNIRYEWRLDSSSAVVSTSSSFLKKFLQADGEKHKVMLKVIDKDNYSCEKSVDFSFSTPRPIWNEIAPK